MPLDAAVLISLALIDIQKQAPLFTSYPDSFWLCFIHSALQTLASATPTAPVPASPVQVPRWSHHHPRTPIVKSTAGRRAPATSKLMASLVLQKVKSFLFPSFPPPFSLSGWTSERIFRWTSSLLHCSTFFLIFHFQFFHKHIYTFIGNIVTRLPCGSRRHLTTTRGQDLLFCWHLICPATLMLFWKMLIKELPNPLACSC